jgi:hypothetical protein
MSVLETPISLKLAPELAGILLSPEEFDAVEECDELYNYELVHRVLIVAPPPSIGERRPNDRLVLQRDFTPVNEVVTDVVFDAKGKPHNFALGGIATPPIPSRGRIPVWVVPPLTRDGPGERSSRSRFF